VSLTKRHASAINPYLTRENKLSLTSFSPVRILWLHKTEVFIDCGNMKGNAREHLRKWERVGLKQQSVQSSEGSERFALEISDFRGGRIAQRYLRFNFAVFKRTARIKNDSYLAEILDAGRLHARNRGLSSFPDESLVARAECVGSEERYARKMFSALPLGTCPSHCRPAMNMHAKNSVPDCCASVTRGTGAKVRPRISSAPEATRTERADS